MSEHAYLAIHEHEDDLLKELELKGAQVVERHGRLVICQGEILPIIWCQVAWHHVQRIPIQSINDGAKKLKTLGRNWALFSVGHHRRAQLIQDELPHYPKRPISFLAGRPQTPMGGWTLLTPELMLASTTTTSLYPLGEMDFLEDKVNPPSRAYLKLWEFFTCVGERPKPQEKVLDMGACPGGWTWVLQGLGCQVIAVDKAPLEERVAKLPNIRILQESAFGLDPASIGPVDWFFSDIICYPERLYQLVRKWHDSNMARNFVCTIKYQSETDFTTTEEFLRIAGSHIVHLHHNKHEVTWWLTR